MTAPSDTIEASAAGLRLAIDLRVILI